VTRENVVDISGAAIVCSHVAVDGDAILRAMRNEPIQAEDSGWQFMCGRREHDDEDDAQVWSISHVLREERTLQDLLNEPAGTTWVRKKITAPWEKK